MSEQTKEVNITNEMNENESGTVPTAAADYFLDEIVENRETRNRQSIKSDIRSRRSLSLGGDEASVEVKTTSFGGGDDDGSRKLSLVPARSVTRRSTIPSTRERVSITMESLRMMALDFDFDDSDDEQQLNQTSSSSDVIVRDENQKKLLQHTSSIRNLNIKKDEQLPQPKQNHPRSSSGRSETIMENLRQLAASLEDDHFKWDSSSSSSQQENDDGDDRNSISSNNNNDNGTSFLNFPSRKLSGNLIIDSKAKNSSNNDTFIGDDLDVEQKETKDVTSTLPATIAVSIPGVKCTTTEFDSCNASENLQQQRQQQQLAQNFAMEHKIFLKAALDLLAERERFAVEASLQLSDPNRIIKAGTLRKSKQFVKGIWKVKYVEIKNGVLTYYDDNSNNHNNTHTTSVTTTTSSSSLPFSLLFDDQPTSTRVNAKHHQQTAIGALQQQPQQQLQLNNYTNRPKRKVIPLVATECRCRALKLSTMSKVKSTYGFIFEVSIPSQRIKSLWMASSTEERQSWMRAIREAMVGGSRTRATTDRTMADYYCRRESSGNYSTNMDIGSSKSLKKNPTWINMVSSTSSSTTGGAVLGAQSPYQTCIEKYLAAQQKLKNASNKQSYMGGMSILWRDPLRIPVHWIRLSMMAASGSSSNNVTAGLSSIRGGAFHEDKVEISVQQLWKDLVRDSVSMNGDLYKGDAWHGPERIMGALASKIRAFDKLSHQEAPSSGSFRKKLRQLRISEAQAISYARDILLACNRTRSAGDSYYCMEMLCSNSDLVVICPLSSEASPLNIVIKRTSKNACCHSEVISKRGWVLVRSRKMGQWENLYCELSDGVLNYYEKEHPTPQKLRGQIVLVDAKMGSGEISNSAAMQLERCRKKLLRLVNESPTFSVNLALSEGFVESANPSSTATTKADKCYVICIINKTLGKELLMHFDEEELFLSWKQSVHKSLESCNNDGFLIKRGNADITVEPAELDNSTEDIDGSTGSAERSLTSSKMQLNNGGSYLETNEEIWQWPGPSTVQVTVEASTIYKICAIDPQGDESEDTWATIQTKFVQSFQLTGGSSGKITRGEEIVQMLLLRGSVSDHSSFDRVLKQRNKAKLVQLEDLSMRNIVPDIYEI